MLLLSLKITNFKGIELFEMKPNGQSIRIYGKNGARKTTIADAISWLLHGKDTMDRAKFEIKALDENGKIIEESRNLEHSVEAKFDCGTFRRALKERWTTKRGSATSEFSGDTTEYFIDGYPKNEKEYQTAIEKIIPPDVYKMVTNPLYFHTILEWRRRRTLLVNAFGNVTNEQVYSANPDLSPLREILSDVSFEDVKKKIGRQQKEISERMEQIPARIEEAKLSIPDASGNVEELNKEIESLSAAKNAEWLKGEQLKNGTGKAEKQRRIVELQTEQARIRRDVEESDEKVNSSIRSENHSKKAKYEDSARQLETAERTIRTLADDVERANQRIDDLKTEWKKENSRTWETIEHAEKNVCPTCGQHLPIEQVQSAMDAAKTRFNAERAARIDSINQAGKAENERRGDIVFRLEGQRTIAESLRSVERPVYSEEIHTEYKGTAEYVGITDEIRRIEEEINALDSGVSDELIAINTRIRDIEAERSILSRQVSAIEQAARTKIRIQELMDEKKRLAAEYENLSKQLFMLERFTMKQCEMVEGNINSHFRLAKFKLFDIQLNGGINECCEVLYHGVPVSTNTSRSENTKVGLDIIRSLTEHFGFSAPIFIDDRESTSEIPDMDGIQLINMYVSPADKTLRVEME